MISHRFEAYQKPKSVLILGGGGFIGRHLIEKLRQEGVEIVAPKSSELDLSQPGCVEQLKNLMKPDRAVVFLSALTPDKGRDVGTLFKNLSMTRYFGEALAGGVLCSQVIYMSSDAVYDGSILPLRESTPCIAADLYGYMHIGREIILKEACAKAKVPYCVLRPCAVYGSEDTHNSYGPNRYLKTAQADGVISLFGEGEETRDHLYVGDAAELVRLTLGRGSTGVLNIATGVTLTFMQAAGTIADCLSKAGKSTPKIQCSARGGPITHRSFDITALARAFPTFRLTSFGEGIKQTLEAIGK